MGELVSGIGDEVLFFIVFLVLSLFIYIGIFLYNKKTQSIEHHDNRPSEDTSTEGSSGIQDTPVTSNPLLDGSTLRARFHSSSNSGPPEAQTESGVSQESSTACPVSMETSQHASASQDDELINIRLIKLDGSVTIRVDPHSTLQTLRRNHFQSEVAQNRPVKFIFQGQVLSDDNASIQSLGIANGYAVHVHVGRPRPPTGEPPVDVVQADQQLDLSGFFVPLFGAILAIVWVSMLCYPHMFSLMTKFFLFSLSLGYVLLAYVTTFT